MEQDIVTDICLEELGHSKSVAEALNRIKENCGRTFTADSLYSHLRRRGLGSPTSYLPMAPFSIPIDMSDFAEDLGKLIRPDTAHVDKPAPSYEFEPLDCGKEDERIFLLPDTHAPFEDKRAWAAAMKAAKALRPHTIGLVGDFMDAYTVSAHDRDPRRLTQLSDEVAYVNGLLDEIDSIGAERVFYVFGNHEFRVTSYLTRRAPELMGIVSVAGLLKLDERGWHHAPYHQHIKVGKLFMTHDAGYSGVYCAQRTGDAFRHNVVHGHSHILSAAYGGTVTGDRYVSANLGWLGSIKEADYMQESAKVRWQHGFGTAVMEKSGNVHVQLVPIVDGKTCVAGKVIS